MDTGRLRSTVEGLIAEEDRLALDAKLQTTIQTLIDFSSNPQQPSLQIQVKSALDDLETSFKQLAIETDPVFGTYAGVLGAERFFGRALLEKVRAIIAENQMTPAAAQQAIQQLQSERQTYLNVLRTTKSTLDSLGVKQDELAQGDAQIGFRIPRHIFNNELKGWIGELRELRLIILPFSELATGNAENMEIGEISTTDPIIFLILKPATVLLLGKAVSWALDQWKKVEDIRKVRAETAQLNLAAHGIFDDMLKQYDEIVVEMIEQATKKHALELVKPPKGAGRGNELGAHMEKALASLVARVERGMTVEIKLLPVKTAGESTADQNNMAADFQSVVSQLKFHPPSSDPILVLPRPPYEKGDEAV